MESPRESAPPAADASLERAPELLRHVFETSPDCITLTERASGRYVMVNAGFTRITGYSPEEVIGKTSLELGIWVYASDRQRLVEAIARERAVRDLPVHFRIKNGQVLKMLVSGSCFDWHGKSYLVLNVRDVSEIERVRLQQEAILQNASIGIAFTRDRVFVHANPRMEEIFGWPPGTLIGQPGSVVWCSEEDYRRIGLQAGPVLSRGEPFETETMMARRDGRPLWCKLRGRGVDRVSPATGGTIWIIEDITERKRFEQELSAARDAAEAASRAKSAFLANTSHELRTPLHGLLGLARLALRQDIDERRRLEYLHRILESAQLLRDIISDILDLSKIEAGQLAIESAPFDLHELLHSVARSHAEVAQAKGLALRVELAEDLPSRVRGDALRLRQIVGNYLSNALKFTEHGQVVLRAERGSSPRVRLSVSDTGPGIPLEQQARLFRPFSQADTSATRRHGGTGLGLSICRELAQLMGGQVGLDSEPGRGSTFWVELPLPWADEQGCAQVPMDESIDLRGVRVLLVEDNPVNLLIGVAMLEQWGLDVTHCSDGRAAIDAVRAAADQQRPYALVLMDLQMPVMGGAQAAQELRREFGPQELPIIALTAAALVSEREAALEAGMNDFLTKPLDASVLHRMLCRWVAARTRGAGASERDAPI
ncbi:ATP-binding protein [Caldimonas taiwanensis]|uniref:ATP-binding protein n=1 Tax=Caldimonas taiwanensis TaxID=307483 RepID=UPI0007821447|nr:ATP-binding protein [Caldimonas taiwanensis]